MAPPIPSVEDFVKYGAATDYRSLGTPIQGHSSIDRLATSKDDSLKHEGSSMPLELDSVDARLSSFPRGS
uniref:Uncharacterized protein n=1 Tax=Steinernema glaseri TaxID=37863 RepID=A0A1I7ZFE2_9BILA